LEYTALELIDELIHYWGRWDLYKEYYLTVLIPSIVDGSAQLGDTPLRCRMSEKEIVAQLKQNLSPEEWSRLPILFSERVAWKEHKQREAERQRELEEQERRRAFRARLRDAFDSDFLSADKVFTGDPDRQLISDEEYYDLKARFVQDWASREIHVDLDPEQAAAIAASEGDILVVARAGSGKTRTLVTRAIFLQKHCGVSPGELLLLAFNRSAADEMRKRLRAAIGDDLPHVMDFHQLAYALVHPEEELLYDQPSADRFNLSREAQEVIDQHVRSKKWGSRIRDLMLAHFREDWERIEAGGFHLAMDELLAYRRSLPRETLRGEHGKSFGEKVIANALLENGVDYRYERNFRWNGVNYRPDFTILKPPRGGVVIECFGVKGNPDYDEMAQQKREFWAQRQGWTLIEFSSQDLAKRGVDGFVHHLLQKLEQAGVPCRQLSDKEIWDRIKHRAIDRFTEAMTNFIGRCRKRNLSPEELERMVARHSPCSSAEELFLDVAISVYRGYLQLLAARKKEDFDGLMWRAVSLIRSGQTQFVRDRGRERGNLANLRFMMIDEFQDFSQMFFELVDAIRSVNQRIRFFCVGDDWQAINAFAGSELRFFRDFDRYFRDTSQCVLPINHRSARSIVELGNAIMFGRGVEAEACRKEEGWVRLCKLDEFKPSPSEEDRHKGDEITPAIL
jgi:DNA helicase-4